MISLRNLLVFCKTDRWGEVVATGRSTVFVTLKSSLKHLPTYRPIDQAWRPWLTSSRVPLELNRWQTPPHSLWEPVDHLQRTLSPSESSAGIAIVLGQPCWCRTMGGSAEIGDELIFPLSCLLVRLTVVDRNQPFPPFASEIQQQPEYLNRNNTFRRTI